MLSTEEQFYTALGKFTPFITYALFSLYFATHSDLCDTCPEDAKRKERRTWAVNLRNTRAPFHEFFSP